MPWTLGQLIDRTQLLVQLEGHLADSTHRQESRERLRRVAEATEGATDLFLEWGGWVPTPGGGEGRKLWADDERAQAHIKRDVLQLEQEGLPLEERISPRECDDRARLLARGVLEAINQLERARDPQPGIVVQMACLTVADKWEIYVVHSPRDVVVTLFMPVPPRRASTPPFSDPDQERSADNGVVRLDFDGEYGRPRPEPE